MTEDTVYQSPETRPRFFYGYVVVAAAFFIMVVTLGVRYSFGVFFKPMLNDFGWTRAMLSGAFSLSWIIESIMSIVLGGLNDRIGPRVVMSVCAVFAAAGYLLMSQMTDITQLYLLYGIIIGIGTSVFTPLVSTTARWFVRYRTAMTGIVIAGISLGALFWPIVIDRLIASADWRITSSIIGGITLLVALAAAQFLKRDPAQVGRLALGDIQTDAERTMGIRQAFSLTEAAKTGQFWLIFFMLICFGFSLLTVQVHLVPFITDMEIPATTAASILATLGAGSVIGRVALGSLGDRIGNRRAIILAFVLMLLSLIYLMFNREVWGYYLFALVFGIAYGDCAAQESPLVAKLFGLKSLGLIFGVVCIGFTGGAAIGPFVSGYIFDITRSYEMAFLVCIILSAIGLILSVAIKPTHIKFAGKL